MPLPARPTAGQDPWYATRETYDEAVEQVIAAIPTGGTDGQVLTKTSGTDYDTAWETVAGGGATLGYFDVQDPAYGAVGDGVTDDRAAVQLAFDAAFAAGGGEVRFTGSKTYKLGFRAGFYGASHKICIFIYGSNVTVSCDPTARILVEEGHANGFEVFSYVGAPGVTPANVDSSGSWWEDNAYMFPAFGGASYPTYEIDPASRYEHSITLATPADHSNFSVGDAIFIRSGQTIPSGGEGQPDAEVNEILAKNTVTGELTLKYPLAKDYVQEYFPDSGRDDATSTSVTAWPALLGVNNFEPIATRNIFFRGLNLYVDQDDAIGQVINVAHAIGFEATDCRGYLKNCVFQTSGPYRNANISRNNLVFDFTIQTDVFVASDRGCGDLALTDNVFAAIGTYPGVFHIHEGSYNILIDRNRVINIPSATNNHAVQIFGRGYAISINGNYINHQSSDTGITIFCSGDAEDVSVTNNDLIGVVGGAGASIGAHWPVIANNRGNISSTAAVTSSPTYVSTYFDFDQSPTDFIIGYMSPASMVIDAFVQIITPFNGTTPICYVGIDGAYGGQFVDGIDLSQVAGVYTDRSVTAGYYQGGGAMKSIEVGLGLGGSTAGRAVVTIGWVPTKQIPGV